MIGTIIVGSVWALVVILFVALGVVHFLEGRELERMAYQVGRESMGWDHETARRMARELVHHGWSGS